LQIARHRQVGSTRPTTDKFFEIKKDSPTAEKKRFVLEPQAIEYLERYHIPYPMRGFAHTAIEAGEIANRIGYPVVLKVVSPDIIHKSDVGGVFLGLKTNDQVVNGYEQIIDRIRLTAPEASIEGVLVCKQAHDGFDAIIGSFNDSVFGPTMMFGMGGIYTEIFKDVTFRIAPVNREEALEMIREIKGYPLLAGTRGFTGFDIEKLAELITTVSRFVTETPKITEMDLNPVRIFQTGLAVLDVRIMEIAN
jgi:acyl-CoA synthetase (NDP forming)